MNANDCFVACRHVESQRIVCSRKCFGIKRAHLSSVRCSRGFIHFLMPWRQTWNAPATMLQEKFPEDHDERVQLHLCASKKQRNLWRLHCQNVGPSTFKNDGLRNSHVFWHLERSWQIENVSKEVVPTFLGDVPFTKLQSDVWQTIMRRKASHLESETRLGVAKLFITIFKESQSPAVGFLYQYQVEEPRKTLAFPSWAEHLQGFGQSDMTAWCLISSTVQALRQRLDTESSFFQRLQLDGKGKVGKEMWCKLPSLILKRLKDIVSLIIASLFFKSHQGHGF